MRGNDVAMTFEPRMRGSRFRRPAMKKQSPKEKRQEDERSRFYEEQTPTDPAEVSKSVLNALGHLGAQRFALPPFSEHFDRWTKDLQAVLSEMETKLPEVIDQTYREESGRILSSVQLALQARTDAEKESYEERSKLQQEFALCDLELSNLEREHKTRTHEARKGHEHSMEKLKGEIDSLDKHRLRLLRKRPSLVDRILHRPTTGLEESTHALQVRRDAIGSNQATLKEELSNLRVQYEASRKGLVERRELVMAKLAQLNASSPDDALAVRNDTCHELAGMVARAIERLSQQNIVSGAENIQ